MKPSSQAGLLKANIDRLKRPEDLTDEDFDQPIEDQPIIWVPAPVKYGAPPTIFAAVGAAVGFIFGPVGAAAGAAAGVAVGGVADAVTAYFSISNEENEDEKEEEKKATS